MVAASPETNNISPGESESREQKDENRRKKIIQQQQQQRFLYDIRYGNSPVMEYKLADGTSGTVEKVPR